MSNIYGIAARNSEASLKSGKLVVPPGYKKLFNSGKILVYTDDGNKNIYSGETENGKFYIAAGTGAAGKIFSGDDWYNELNREIPFTNYPDGHYVVIIILGRSIKFYTDPTGIRDLYFMQTTDEIYFSTRPDWFSNFGEIKINFSEFGTRWLLFNQLSHNAVFEGIGRITAGRSAEINIYNHDLHIDEADVQSRMSDEHYSFDEIFEKIKNQVLKAFDGDVQVSLSLSGGMDSRVILSYLMNSNYTNWDTHTFGDDKHPDARVARSICNELGIDHVIYKHHYPPPGEAVKLLRNYSCQTLVNNSASAIIQFQLYDNLAGINSVIIDGGFGEIWRRDFFNRLLYRGKKDIIRKNSENIYPHLRVHRADIFNKEINEQMREGALVQIAELFESNPSIGEIGVENWLDLTGIKTRLANYYGPEQSRLDLKLISYMPFAQKSLLDILLSVPVRERRDGKIFRKIIDQNSRELRKYPLAKGSFTYPYRLGTLQSRIYSVIRRKLKWKLYSDNVRKKFLDTYSGYIRDNINSQRVRECELYDYSKVKYLAEKYYKGNESLAYELDWWLAFDEFRRGLEKIRPEA